MNMSGIEGTDWLSDDLKKLKNETTFNVVSINLNLSNYE